MISTHILVVLGAGAPKVNVSELSAYTKLLVTMNSYPEGGIALIEPEKVDVRWDWPDYVALLGHTLTDRHNYDIVISEHEDPIGALTDWLQTIEESEMEDSSTGPVE